MRSDRETTRVVQQWLETGVTVLPDRVFDAVLDRLPATRQRRRWRPALRFPPVNHAFTLGAAAAAVVLVGVIGMLPAPTRTDVGAPVSASPTLVATAAPSRVPGSASPGPVALPAGRLEAGRYHVDVALHDYATSGGPALMWGGSARVTFDVPDGWVGFEGWAITKAGAGTSGELALAPMTIESIYLDPCRWATGSDRRGPSDWDRGRTVNGLADGLWTSWASAPGPGYAARSGVAPTSPTATKPTNAMLAGLGGRYVEVRTPLNLDLATCDGGQYTLWVDLLGGQRYVHRAGELNRLWIVDLEGSAPAVPGGLLVLDAASHPDSSAQDLAELQAIVDSIEIELLAGS